MLLLTMCDLCNTHTLSLSFQLRQADSRLHVMVNWMHGASHEIQCQLEHCGRFMLGAACVVGEQIEQLWSQTKVCCLLCCNVCFLLCCKVCCLLCSQTKVCAFYALVMHPSFNNSATTIPSFLLPCQKPSKILKYMTRANRRDYLEFVLSDIAHLKECSLVARLAKTWKHMSQKSQELQAEIGNLQYQAQMLGKFVLLTLQNLLCSSFLHLLLLLST